MFPYWIRMLDSSGSIVAGPRCIMSQPNWMSDNRASLGDLTIGDMMFVKTHDAAAYKWVD